MGIYERRTHFEKLLALREAYCRAEHLAGDLTIAAAIAYAEVLLDDPTALDAVIGAGSSSDPTAPTGQPA